MGEAVCELYGCGCEATKFGFARMCDSCYANVTKELREQIAREDEKVGDSYVCPRLPHPAGMSGCDYCSGVQDGLYLAAIMARGEPNQVTKDAIEEARKMNES